MASAAAQGSYYTKHAGGVAVYHEGRSFSASTAHPLYEDILKALKKGNVARAAELLDVKGALVAASKGSERIKFENGRMMYKGLNGKNMELDGPLIDRIMNALKTHKLSPQKIKPLMLFLDNIMKNELKDIRDELYLFLMAGDMPITNDGCFLAYKKVRDNFHDVHSGKFDNSPGKVVAMPAHLVDRDRHNTCSTGLHFAARSYLSQFGGSRIIAVKVNPRNVFAIPSDYNNAKGRASEYFVVGECKNAHERDAFLEDFIFDENKEKVAPDVKFIAGGLKASLGAMAEGYKLAFDVDGPNGRAYVRTVNSKGALTIEKYSIVKKDEDGAYFDSLTGKPVPEEHVKEMAISTKSVRSALVRAVAKARRALR
jgi:hypothetical protein